MFGEFGGKILNEIRAAAKAVEQDDRVSLAVRHKLLDAGSGAEKASLPFIPFDPSCHHAELLSLSPSLEATVTKCECHARNGRHAKWSQAVANKEVSNRTGRRRIFVSRP